MRPRRRTGLDHRTTVATALLAAVVLLPLAACADSSTPAADNAAPSPSLVNPQALKPGSSTGASGASGASGATVTSPASHSGSSAGSGATAVVSGTQSGGFGSPASSPTSDGGGTSTNPVTYPGTPPTIAPSGGLIWVGDPAKGESVFYLDNCAAPGTVTTVDDARMGLVWKYTKPAGDLRCESHGIRVGGSKYTFQNNSTYYIGWWSKLTDLTSNNADFQWKSYGAGFQQNYPFVVSVGNGHAGVFQRQPDSHGSTVWQSAQPLVPNQWVHYVIGVHTSDQLTGGWIQLWFNGAPQTFVDGSTQYRCRTFDVQNDPKWGEYGAQGADVTNYVTAQKIGTSYDVVAR